MLVTGLIFKFLDMLPGDGLMSANLVAELIAAGNNEKHIQVVQRLI